METVTRGMEHKSIWLGAWVAALLAPFTASAGTELYSPLANAEAQEEQAAPQTPYAESYFGRPPSRVRPRYEADREVYGAREGDGDGAAEGAGPRRGPAADSTPVAAQPPQQPIFSRPIPPGVLESIPAKHKGVQEVALIAGDLGFFPKTVFVTRDIPVRMFVTGASKNTLCIMMDSFQVRKQVRSQRIEEITFTPSTPGKYRFYCPVNGTEGTMIVKELASSVEPQP